MPAPTRISTQTLRVNYSASFTIPADCTFVVALVGRSGSGGGFSCTLNGVSMTQQVSQDNFVSSISGIYTLASPATGARTFAVSSAAGDYRATLVYYKDVGGTPVVAANAATPSNASSFSLNVTSEADADVLDVVTVEASGTLTQGGSQTLIDNTSTVSPAQMFGTSVRSATGTPTNMSWTASTSGWRAHCGIAIRGAAVGATPRRRSILRAPKNTVRAFKPQSRLLFGATKTVALPTPPGLDPIGGDATIDITRIKRHRTAMKGGR